MGQIQLTVDWKKDSTNLGSLKATALFGLVIAMVRFLDLFFLRSEGLVPWGKGLGSY